MNVFVLSAIDFNEASRLFAVSGESVTTIKYLGIYTQMHTFDILLL